MRDGNGRSETPRAKAHQPACPAPARGGVSPAARPLCSEAHVVADELGRPYRPEWYSDEFERQLRAARKVADLPRVPLHGSRRAAASLLGSMGLPILNVAAWLGQSQISVTAGYQHAGSDGLSDVAQRFSDALTGESERIVRLDLSATTKRPGQGLSTRLYDEGQTLAQVAARLGISDGAMRSACGGTIRPGGRRRRVPA